MFQTDSSSVSGKLLSLMNCCLLVAYLLAGSVGHAQKPQSRIAGSIMDRSRTVLAGSRSPLARPQNDMGRVDTSLPLDGMTLVFSRSQSQEQDLEALLAAQQSTASPLYHAWLTPEQFGARFGMSDADLAKATAWLQQQGFAVNAVSRSRDQITFSGTVAQVEAAFQTEIHHYLIRGETKFAPASAISLPSALSAVTTSITDLNSIRPRSHARVRKPLNEPTGNFTSSQTGSHYLSPGDIRTIYDINPAYNSGYNGTGQTIAVVGQSAIVTSDIERFQRAAGLTVKDPVSILVPNTGTSAVYSDDESESDLDLEYSGAIAPGATITFVYAGNNANSSVLDAERYAIQTNVAPIISISYGECEQVLGATEYAAENAIFQQAAAQGQTVVAAAGDDGSSDCVRDGRTGLYADFPASSQYVTGMGGTEFGSGAAGSTNSTYWTQASGSDVIASALSYIPEQVWNDSTSQGLSAGGGGTSVFTARPSWQANVPGISNGSYRMVPDISLTSSPTNAGYLYCSSDISATGVSGSCSNGFRDVNNKSLTVAGGTSFAAPIFAGMVALINQSLGSTAQGLVNPKLYALAGNSTTYAKAFHDITSGTNACTAAYQYCAPTASGSYSAAVGYDQATGLGSVDLYNLLTAWPFATPLLTSTTNVTAATAKPASGANDGITISVASGSSTSGTVPTGTVAISVDGTTVTTVPLSAGAATYTFASSISGMHTVTAAYSGDTIYGSSTGSVTLTIPAGPFASMTTISAATMTPANGAADAISIRVTSASSSATGTPTGALTITDKSSSSATTTLLLSGGAATYNFSSIVSGAHVITVAYSGDTTFMASSATVTLTVPVVLNPAFTVAATGVALVAGTSASSTVTVTPANGYTGTVQWTVQGPANLTNACYNLSNATVDGTAAVSKTMTVYTSASACGSLSPLAQPGRTQADLSRPAYVDGTTPGRRVLFAWLFAGAFGLCGIRSRRLRALLLCVTGAIAFSLLTGCGSGGSSNNGGTSSTNAPSGSYIIRLIGTDTGTGIAASTSFTVTIN